MPTLASIDGRTLAANVGPQLSQLASIFERDRIREEEEAARKTQEEKLQALLKDFQAGQADQEFQIPPDAIDSGEERVKALTASVDPSQRTPDQQALGLIQTIKPDLAKELLQVIQGGDQEQLTQLKEQAQSGIALGDAILAAPDLAAKRKSVSDAGQAAVLQGQSPARTVELLNMDEDHLNLEAKRLQLIGNGFEILLPTRRFLDTPEGVRTIALIAANSPEAAQAILAVDKQRRGKTGRERFTKAPGVIVRLPDGGFAQSIPVLNEATGEIENKIVPIEGGVPVSRLGETGQETRLGRVEQARGTAVVRRDIEQKTARGISEQAKRGTAEETRRQDSINKGVEAADALSIIKRGIDLLDSVNTGGVSAAALQAKQFFGVEGADEAELSANLGKAVLSQLRSTFGAAFTEREGARLQNIEAGFGKSAAANRRLLRQTQRILERIANRAIRIAEQGGDTDTADEIREAMAFDLTEGISTNPPSPAGTGKTGQAGTPIEGDTVTNPATGEKMILRDGQWQTL